MRPPTWPTCDHPTPSRPTDTRRAGYPDTGLGEERTAGLSADCRVVCGMRGQSAQCRCPRGAKCRHPLQSADNTAEPSAGARPDRQQRPVVGHRDHPAAHAKAGPEQWFCSGPAFPGLCGAGLSARARFARAPVNRQGSPTHHRRPSAAPAGAQRVAMEPSAWR